MAISFKAAVEFTTRKWLNDDPNFQVIGIGADYPNGLDGTMADLAEAFPSRVFDVPMSESSFTGLALGRAISGKRTLVHHGRTEFALFAADQIFNQAAKWRYQFGGSVDVYLTIRVAIGRQWGNGPQHTASYIQMFGSVPGLRTFIPSSPAQAARLLDYAIALPDPVIFLEPRWLYSLEQEFSLGAGMEFSAARGYDRIGNGTDVAIVTLGEGVIDAAFLAMQLGSEKISVFDLWDLTPNRWDNLLSEISRFPKIVLFDPYCSSGGPLTELAGQAVTVGLASDFHLFRPPNVPVPTATSLTEAYYLNRAFLATELNKISPEMTSIPELGFSDLHLPPRARIGGLWDAITFLS